MHQRLQNSFINRQEFKSFPNVHTRNHNHVIVNRSNAYLKTRLQTLSFNPVIELFSRRVSGKIATCGHIWPEHDIVLVDLCPDTTWPIYCVYCVSITKVPRAPLGDGLPIDMSGTRSTWASHFSSTSLSLSSFSLYSSSASPMISTPGIKV